MHDKEGGLMHLPILNFPNVREHSPKASPELGEEVRGAPRPLLKKEK